ncbi:cobalt-zinc-cadmium efflux system outer membrane protein [Caulobacter sp. BE264]|uniref:TolC family protein n=1 Tax=Caulobacter sp. BE264 TaxID=2817724 RepID=UPI0028637571|nr:TolC family protein [Caulobacter sp. BE264]MDR7229925.1 cobalt-zinc-cadmium efflux system outer membrane protein [Caulobacter sp. BE264]
MFAPHQGRALRPWLLATALALATTVSAHAEPLTLPEALSLAAKADPARPALAARLSAAEAGARQAAVRPNPVIGLEVEDVAGSGSYSLVDRAQATIYYQQSQERGGKRAARTALARSDIALARLRDDVRVLDLFHEVELIWIDAVAAEAEARLAADRLAIAERAQAEVGRRVRAARDPLFAGARADAQVAEARITLAQATTKAANARHALSAFWGGGEIEIDPAVLENLTAADQVAAPASPTDLALLDAQRDLARAKVRVEESKAVQDPTWRAGLRYLNDGGDVAAIVGGSIPFGRYDTNRGAIDQARAAQTAADLDLIGAKMVFERKIAAVQASLAQKAVEARRIDTEIIPANARTVDLVREGFNRGGFSYLDVLEAQKALIDARSRRLTVLKSFQIDRAQLNRLTGAFASLVPASETAR